MAYRTFQTVDMIQIIDCVLGCEWTERQEIGEGKYKKDDENIMKILD